MATFWCTSIMMEKSAQPGAGGGEGCTLGGFNFILFWNFNRNQTGIDRYRQKNIFLLFAKCLKMYSFFAFAFKVCKKCYYDPKNFFS
jgi:hypothetical protein